MAAIRDRRNGPTVLGAIGLCGLFGLLAMPGAAAADALAREVTERGDHVVHDATCGEIVPIISNPMRGKLIDEASYDTQTALMPVFIYGYAMAKGQSFDEALFELIELCGEDPGKPFAGFPAYRPDPRFHPPEFIEIWDNLHGGD